jgi:hypothetical protein
MKLGKILGYFKGYSGRVSECPCSITKNKQSDRRVRYNCNWFGDDSDSLFDVQKPFE